MIGRWNIRTTYNGEATQKEKRMKILFCFNGRSVSGILADARKHVSIDDHEILVVVRDGDAIPPPEGLKSLGVEEAKSFLGKLNDRDEVVLVANGGTSAQLVPVLANLVGEYVGTFKVLDLQRDGMTVLLERAYPRDKRASELSKGEASDLYFGTCW